MILNISFLFYFLLLNNKMGNSLKTIENFVDNSYDAKYYRKKYSNDSKKTKIVYDIIGNDKINFPFTAGTDMKKLVHIQTIIPVTGSIIQMAYDTKDSCIKNKVRMRHENLTDNKWSEWYD